MINKLLELGLPITGVSTFSSGTLNYVYKGEYFGKRVVVKVFNREFDVCESRFANELAFLKSYSNLKIPRLVDYSEEGKWIMTEFVGGRSLKEKEMLGEIINLESLVSVLREIHSAEEVHEEGLVEEYLKQRILLQEKRLNASKLDGDLYSYIISGLNYLNEKRKQVKDNSLCVVNGDLNGSNILLDKAGSVSRIIDWEFFHIGSKYLDLAQLCNRETDFDRQLLETYFAKGMDEPAFDFFQVYFLIKLVINNSGDNLKKMAVVRNEKIKIINSKIDQLKKRFGHG